MSDARAALAAELLADLPASLAERARAALTRGGIDAEPAVGAAVAWRRDEGAAVREALASLEPMMAPALALLSPDDLGEHLTLRWEASLALASLADAADDAVREALERWDESVAFWASEPGAEGEAWRRLVARVAPEPAPEPPPAPEPEVAVVTEAPSEVWSAPPPESPSDAEPPAPAESVVAAPVVTAPSVPAEVAAAYAFLREHGSVDLRTLDRLTGHARWSRLFSREVHALAAADGADVRVDTADGARVWRLER